MVALRQRHCWLGTRLGPLAKWTALPPWFAHFSHLNHRKFEGKPRAATCGSCKFHARGYLSCYRHRITSTQIENASMPIPQTLRVRAPQGSSVFSQDLSCESTARKASCGPMGREVHDVSTQTPALCERLLLLHRWQASEETGIRRGTPAAYSLRNNLDLLSVETASSRYP